MKRYLYTFTLKTFFLLLGLVFMSCGGGSGNGGGNGGLSSSPAKPENLRAEGSDRQVTLTWTAEDGVSYTLFYSTTASVDVDSSATMSFSNVTPPHIHESLTNNTTYYYRLTAVNSLGSSEPSEEVSVTPRFPVTWISAGDSHTCAVVNGFAKCWGEVDNGQLGNGASSGADQTTPQQVTGLTSGVTQISTGEAHTCAVAGGIVKCWGRGSFGQLGTGNTSGSNTPRQVIGLTSGVTQISAGGFHTCAVVNGAAKCWGRGNWGQLGNHGTNDAANTRQVADLFSGVTDVSTGYAHSCAVVGERALCWGFGIEDGRLGDNAMEQRNAPVGVHDLTSGVTQISARQNHTCAVAGGRALCWGKGDNGQLGRGNNSGSNTPQQVVGLTSGVTQISAGRAYTCAVAGGRALCWGKGDNGQLGRGNNSGSNTPQQVMGLTSGVTQISAGRAHTCAVAGGRALCWGNGDNGRLGDGMEIQRNTPVQVHDDIYN